MQKHKLLELNKIIEERIGSLREVEIANNVKLNPLYIVDRKDEMGDKNYQMGFRSS